jgi:hypothetical protein
MGNDGRKASHGGRTDMFDVNARTTDYGLGELLFY